MEYLIHPIEYLSKIINSNYIVCLKRILTNNQTSGRGDPAFHKKLRKGMSMFLLFLHLATIFVTIQYNTFSNTVVTLSGESS